MLTHQRSKPQLLPLVYLLTNFFNERKVEFFILGHWRCGIIPFPCKYSTDKERKHNLKKFFLRKLKKKSQNSNFFN